MIETFDPNNEKPITFTDEALLHFKNYLHKQNAVAIQVAIKTTGCSGLAYDITPIKETPKHFILLKEEGVDFYIDPKALQYINGLHVDYAKKDLGLSQLVYHNPNEAASCGCGESFTVSETGLSGAK